MSSREVAANSSSPVRARLRVVIAATLFGGAVAIFDHGPDQITPKDVVELASELSRASGTVVRPDDVRWQPAGSMLGDLFVGRFVVFLGSATAGAPRDVYRARVRLSPEGRPLAIASVSNLTSTPIGDDHALVVSGTRAAFATSAFGQEQSVTALDLAGEGSQNATTKLHDRLMAWVTNVQQTGSGEGVGRVDVALDPPARRVGLRIDPRALAIDLADDDHTASATRTARLDLEKIELSVSVARSPMHAEPAQHLPKPPVFWAVDTVRAVPWIGPAPIAWLEEKVFAARDEAKRALFRARAGEKDTLAVETPQPPAAVLDPSQAGVDLGHWPPANLASIWKTPEPGEGEWEEPKQPWIKRMPKASAGGSSETPPSPFYRTFVRPDEERPYVKVLLVAMDMRQLDLDMEAGSEDPKPLTGPPGTGRLPREPAIYSRVAAAFNGGFKTEHGTYGMMLKKRVLLPALPGAATVVLTKDGRVGMGSWGSSKDLQVKDFAPSEIVSFRQNLDPLLDNDKVNPLGRWQWGFTLPGTSMQTERSGICITAAGHLVYAWGEDLSATTLGKAMKIGGCVYGMHLDMNPHHTGFTFTNITEFKGRNYKSELLTTQMGIDTDRYLLYAPKDFFFVSLHDPTPPAFEGATWEPDPGVQPAPGWMAGLWHARSGSVDLVEIEPGRATFRVRAGTKEPEVRGNAAGARDHELAPEDAKRVLFALTVGTSDAKRPRGLVTSGRVALAVTSGERSGVLVASEDGQLAIVRAKDFDAPPARADAVELPMLLDDGEVVGGGHGDRANAALGLTEAGRVFVARGAGHDELASTLKRAGCTRAVLLSRGGSGAGTMFRAGTAMPPRSRYEETTIYAMSKPLLPRGFRFEPKNPVEPPKKK